jgi:hypothetical protein
MFMKLYPFLGTSQAIAIIEALKGEEGEWFAAKVRELLGIVKTMPDPYVTDGQGRSAIAQLHYFHANGSHWYITERDSSEAQIQAFGLADLGMGYPELGYINIFNICQHGAELDLHWTPKPLHRINPDG